MIVKVEIRGTRAIISGEPGSEFAPFEETSTRLRHRFAEGGKSETLVGYFAAENNVVGEADAACKCDPVLAEVFEIGERVYPKKTW